MYNYNNYSQLEIGILKKKILAFKPCYARIYIPSLMGYDSNSYINIPMPLHLSITYGDITIPEGTKIIVQTVSGDYNDMRIIGFYDKPKNINFIEYISDIIKSNNKSLPDDYNNFDYDEII